MDDWSTTYITLKNGQICFYLFQTLLLSAATSVKDMLKWYITQVFIQRYKTH